MTVSGKPARLCSGVVLGMVLLLVRSYWGERQPEGEEAYGADERPHVSDRPHDQ
jgi:hypothetical protein